MREKIKRVVVTQAKDLRRRLLNISHWLGKIPSLGYGLLYLLLIPTFATVYYFLPHHFYHSTVQYEESVHNDAVGISKGLKELVLARFEKSHNGPVAKFSGWVLDTKPTFDINDLTVTDNEASANLVFLLQNEDKQTMDLVRAKIKFLVYQPTTPYSGKDLESILREENKVVTIEGLSTPDLVLSPEEQIRVARELFPYDYESLSGRKIFQNSVILPVPWQLSRKIESFAKGMHGFPSDIEGSFLRMFYFSAATITTLGYGDIVPITSVARFLITVEAILGIVLIGLFLNALAYGRNGG